MRGNGTEDDARLFDHAARAEAHGGGDLVVPVGVDVGLDIDPLADGALGREAASLDLRRDRTDDDPATTIVHGRLLPRPPKTSTRRAATVPGCNVRVTGA